MSGKGSKPRPFSVSSDEFGDRFDSIDWSHSRQDEAKEEVSIKVGNRIYTHGRYLIDEGVGAKVSRIIGETIAKAVDPDGANQKQDK